MIANLPIDTTEQPHLEEPPPLLQVGSEALDALLPPRRSNPIEWVSKNVFFPPTSGATPRPYDHFLFPWHRGVWEAFMDDRIREISLRWAAQHGGKTAIMQAMVAYIAVEDPCPMIWGGPDLALVRRTFERKLYPLFTATPETNRLLPPRHQQKQKSEVDFRNCMLFSAGSGSPSQLGDLSARVVFMNELDKWTRSVSTEGDPAMLIEERKKAFRNWKIIRESTPSEDGLSRIDDAILSSDNRRFWIPCPKCKKYQTLDFENLKMPHNDDGRLASKTRCRNETYYPCAHCSRPIEDHEKLPAMHRGVWLRDGEKIDRSGRIRKAGVPENTHAGFSLSSLYSPIVSWGEIGERWAASQRDVGKIRAFVNGWLARSYAPKARVTNEAQVLRHRGIEEGLGYPRDTCPEMPVACFLLVDVQSDSLWYSSWAWCRMGKRYLLRYGQLPFQLESCLPVARNIFRTAAGDKFRHTHCLMDSGYGDRTQQVYDFCKRHNFIPTKGFDTGARTSLIKWGKVQDINLLHISVVPLKDNLSHSIHNSSLDDPGAWRLFDTTGLDYAEQMTAEKRIVKRNAYGRITGTWVNASGRDNHYWDLAVMAEAAALALELEGLDFWLPPKTENGSDVSEKDRNA